MRRLLLLIIALALPIANIAAPPQSQASSNPATGVSNTLAVAVPNMPAVSNATAVSNTPVAVSNSVSGILSNTPAAVSNAACLPPPVIHRQPTPGGAGQSSLQNAVALYKSYKWAAAAEQFGVAAREFPVIGDYALFYQAKALKQIKNNDEALEAANLLVSKYPKSPLLKKAKWMAISLTSGADASLIPRLEDYVEHYPSDQRANMKLALALEAQGRTKDASDILEKLYVSAGRYSGQALKELGRAPTAAESLVRIGSLLRQYRPRQAELEARAALASQDKTFTALNQEFLGALAQALFMQKRYVESAGVFLQTGDNYNAARAYFRAGDDVSFGGLLNGFLASGDKRAAYLLLSLAGRKRREHKPDEALSLLDMVRQKYPDASEDALWETGWLYYMQHDYKDALDVFTKLSANNPEPVYLYWKARSIENMGDANSGADSKAIYRKLSGKEDYYGILASERLGSECRSKHSIFAMTKDEKDPLAIKRASILVKAGLRDDAMLELASASSHITDPALLVEIALKLEQLGAFRRAMVVAERVPEDMQPKAIIYPKAFWAPVEKSCSEDNLDPYLLLSVMRQESGFDPEARSQAGALGLMQLMPRVARKYGRALRLGLKTDDGFYDVGVNIEIGAYYLKSFIKGFKSVPEALAAYNAGKNAVTGWLANGNYASTDEFVEDIPYGETKNYVKRIITSYYEYGGRKAVDEAFGKKAVGIVHAAGQGKTGGGSGMTANPDGALKK